MSFLKRDTRHVLLGVGIGAAALSLAPAVLPALSATVRPFFKSVLTRAWLGGLRLREHVAVLGESLDDLFAEVHADVQAELSRRTDGEAAKKLEKSSEPRASSPNGTPGESSRSGGGLS